MAINSLADRKSIDEKANMVMTTYSGLFDDHNDGRKRLMSQVTSELASWRDNKDKNSNYTEEMMLLTILDKMNKRHKSLTSDPLTDQ